MCEFTRMMQGTEVLPPKEYIQRPGEVAANQVVTPVMMCTDAASEEREAIDQSQDAHDMMETVPN